MVYYECQRCGYNTTLRGNIKHHLNRKNICQPILDNISIEEMKDIYNLNEINKIHQNNTIYTKITPNCNKITPIYTKNYTKKMDIKHCSYCGKEFSRRDSLTRHLNRCKIKKENEIETNKIEILEKHNTELLKAVEKLLIECSNNNNKTSNKTLNNNNHNTNSLNTTNNNNTIIINNYGEEDTKYITSDFILKLLKNKPFKAIPEMIKHTHFNKEHPENQNIKITNKKEPYVKIMKDNKWEFQDRKNTITDLIDKQHIKISDEKVEEQIERQCTSQEKINIIRCNDMYMEEEDDYMKRLYNESELVMFNN
jgi:hypothetical protein